MKVSIELKSTTSFRLCLIILFFLFFIMKILCIEVKSDSKHKEIIEDLPTAKDFDVYLTQLEKIVDFCVNHKIYVDINLEFGLFLINVNLKPVLKDKGHNIPTKVRYRLEQLMLKNDVLTDYFHYMVDHDNNEQDGISKRLTTLFYNESLWPRHLHKFNTDLLKQTKIYTQEQLEKIYGKWENYETNVYDYAKYKPTPLESDHCIESLAGNPPSFNQRTPGNCHTPPSCKQGIKSGSEFGYGLTHRILFMVVARFSRGCTVFSVKEDQYKVDKYCMRCFNEGQFIAVNDYQLPDLMMEQIALCGLYGHAQFLRNSWLKNLFDYQTTEGCFTDLHKYETYQAVMKEGDKDAWKIENSDNIMSGGCAGHLTAVASGTIATVLRYILESYY